jgi:putative membrane protein insertion efficiency factor
VRAYRWFLSPLKSGLFGPTAGCRHIPSCSAFAEEAIRTHGAVRGSWLALRRIGRCHPWGTAGFDPVPPPERRPAPRGAATAWRIAGVPRRPV